MPLPLLIPVAVGAYNVWGAVREEFDLPSAGDLLASGYRAVVGDDEEEEGEDYEDEEDEDDYDDYDEGDEE